jgi:histone deacetylase 11
MMIPVVYSPGYNFTACGLERLHPFDGSKYRRIHDELRRQGLRHRRDFQVPSLPTSRQLLSVHSSAYLRSLYQSRELARILEFPVLAYLPAVLLQWRILRPMRLAAGGTLLACRLALEQGLAINLGGGFHHASGQRGGGFCIYADVPMALKVLHQEGRIHSALIIDTDAHQGDGTADAIRPWGWARMLDLYDNSIFPPNKVEETYPVPLAAGTGGEEYLRVLTERLRDVLAREAVDLVVYNAGSDVLASDPLARLVLNEEHLETRDLLVVNAVRERGIPLALVLSGGYGPLSWRAHARSIEAILTRYDELVPSVNP